MPKKGESVEKSEEEKQKFKERLRPEDLLGQSERKRIRFWTEPRRDLLEHGYVSRGEGVHPTPEREAEEAAYFATIGGKRQLVVPCLMVRAALSGALAKWTLKGRMRARKLIGYAVDIESPTGDDKIPLGHADYEIFTKDAVIQTGARVERSRPRIKKWAMVFYLVYESDCISLQTPENVDSLIVCMIKAGTEQGIGDWRPSAPKNPGTFGTWDTVKFERDAKIQT